jgi:DNA polymerase-3 subunit alpha
LIAPTIPATVTTSPSRREVRLKVDARRAPAGLVRELARLLSSYPGESPVVLDMELSTGLKRLAFGPAYRVAPDADFYAEVKTLLGEAAVA